MASDNTSEAIKRIPSNEAGELDKLHDLYYNQKQGYLSLHKLWKRVTEVGIKLSYGDVERFLEQQQPYELHKQENRPEEFSHIYADKILQCTQMDVMIYNKFEFNHYKYVLGVIDVYSRRVACRAMTHNDEETVMKNLEDIFVNDFKGLPDNINCDNQFTYLDRYDFLKGARKWFSLPHERIKNSIIERFWRTLSLLLARMREASNQGLRFNWVKALPNAIENYNSAWHSSIKTTPNAIWEGTKTNPIQPKMLEGQFKKGMHVRIKHARGVLEKGDVRTVSKEIYKIVGKRGTTNTLQNIKTDEILERKYHDYELSQTFTWVEKIPAGNPAPPMPEEKDELAIGIAEHKVAKKLSRLQRELEINMNDRAVPSAVVSDSAESIGQRVRGEARIRKKPSSL